MYPEILLCVSQEENTTPYKFMSTGIQVFSLEEALYHTFHYWKQSIDDFASDEFISWINDSLNLSYVGAQMKEIAKIDSFAERLLRFLNITEYFDTEQIDKLKIELESWEKQLEWERLKDRGDYLVQRDDPAKALMLYKKALAYEENQQLLNNMGIALMRLEKYDESVRAFERALDKGETQLQIVLNLAESAIYNREFNKALNVLRRAESMGCNESDLAYLYGALYFEVGNMRDAVSYYEKAISSSNEPHYIYRLSDVYVKMRQYDKALDVLDLVQKKDEGFLVKQAQVCASGGNIPAAIKSIERALLFNNKNVDLWTKLAMYHRLNYDMDKADAAVKRALLIDPDDARAKLESARIKKGMGKTKEYQTILNQILKGYKKRYRETYVE